MKNNRKIQIVGLILIGLFSFYALSVKFGQGDINLSYGVFIIDILRGFSVGATIISLIGSSGNLFVFFKKINIRLITSYNFKIFSLVYNLIAGVTFGCGIFTYGGNDYILARLQEPLSFSGTLIGHLVIPILLTIYSIIYRDYCVINRTYYKKDFWLVLIFPFLYSIFMLFRSFYLIQQYKIKGININDYLDFISPYGFLSGFIYGGSYGILSMLFFGIITLVLTLIINLISVIKKNS